MPSSGSSVIDGLITLFAREMRPVVGLLMVHTVFGAILVPLLLALLYFSTARLRRTPIFWVVLLDILVGLGVAVWDVAVLLSVLFDPLAGIPRTTYIAFPLIQSLATWVVDASLLVRLVAVFPPVTTRTRTLVAVFSVPALVKAARLTLIAASVVTYTPTVVDVANATTATTTNLEIVGNPMIIAESACQLVDHLYVTCLFLWKLRSGFMGAKDSGRMSDGSRDSVAGRIRTLFLIALGNFVFPVLFNVALILILTVGRERIDIVYVVPANVYVTIFGVVFATVWNSAHAVAEQGRTRASAPDENALPPLAFKHSYPSGTEMTRTVDRHVAGRKESDASFLDITVHRSQIMQRI